MDTTKPLLCYTAGGMLIHDGQVLLVKHKKLGIWLNPGGHIEDGELPHQTAEREFFEETGVEVQAIDPLAHSLMIYNKSESDSTFYPNPISTNVHWVNRESYHLRQQAADATQRVPTAKWKRGCEQHVGFFYLFQPVGGISFTQNTEETDGIAWFKPESISTLETHQNVKHELQLGFTIWKRLS